MLRRTTTSGAEGVLFVGSQDETTYQLNGLELLRWDGDSSTPSVMTKVG